MSKASSTKIILHVFTVVRDEIILASIVSPPAEAPLLNIKPNPTPITAPPYNVASIKVLLKFSK